MVVAAGKLQNLHIQSPSQLLSHHFKSPPQTPVDCLVLSVNYLNKLCWKPEEKCQYVVFPSAYPVITISQSSFCIWPPPELFRTADPIIPHLAAYRRLPVNSRIDFQNILIFHKAVNGRATACKRPSGPAAPQLRSAA